jgi:hypothetical protein
MADFLCPYVVEFSVLLWRLELAPHAWEVPSSIVVPEDICPETFVVHRWDGAL